MLASRYSRCLLPMLAVALAAMPLSARAQGKLEAAYGVSLAGIPIGAGTWTIDVTDTHYTATATGEATGLMRVFTGGHGSTTASGTLAGSPALSSVYASTIFSHKKTDDIHITIEGGNVKELKLDPPLDTEPDRVPLDDAARKGVLDPMTASLLRTPGTGDPVAAEACQRTLSVFDGRMRYDLQLSFKRIEQVKAAKGYNGPAVVCGISFTPVAGYIPSRGAIRYIAKQRDIEVWLAPIAGTHILVPYRAQSPTLIGPVVLEATRFVSLANPTKASVNGAKTQ